MASITEFDGEVCTALYNMVYERELTRQYDLKTYGYLYNILTEDLHVQKDGKKHQILLRQIPKDVAKHQKSTKMQIVESNTIKRIKDKLTKVIASLSTFYDPESDTTSASEFVVGSDIADVRVLGIVYLLWLSSQSIQTFCV